MAWLILLLAGLAETSWVIGLKHTAGLTRVVPLVFTVVMMIVSFILLSQAVKTLPVGTAYAVWVGIGATGTLIVGMFLLGEPKELMRVGCAAIIVIGIIGLHLTDRPPALSGGGADSQAAMVTTER